MTILQTEQTVKTWTDVDIFRSWITNNIPDLKLRFTLYRQGLAYYRKHGIYLITY